jgi:hypothetical protein
MIMREYGQICFVQYSNLFSHKIIWLDNVNSLIFQGKEIGSAILKIAMKFKHGLFFG